MARLQSLSRIAVRLFAVLLGFGLLGHLVLRSGPGIVWKQLQAVGWGLALIVVLGGVSQLVKAWAWRQTFTCDISRLAWSRSVGTQLVSDALGQLGAAGKLLGEGMRVSLLGSAVPLSSGISAAAIDGALHAFTAVIVTVLGIAATLLVAPLTGKWRIYGMVLPAVLIAVVTLAAVSFAHRWRLAGKAARLIGRLPQLHRWIGGKQPIIDSAEDNLLNFYRTAPGAFWAGLALNFLWHVLAILEVYLVLRFMGASVALIGALVLEGLTKMINLVGTLNPGNVGTYEAGNMLLVKMFGITGTAGLTLALCRRARAIFWAAVGFICMVMMRRPKGPGKSEAPQSTRKQEPSAPIPASA